MKIALYLRELRADGGVYTSVKTTAKALLELGHDVTLVYKVMLMGDSKPWHAFCEMGCEMMPLRSLDGLDFDLHWAYDMFYLAALEQAETFDKPLFVHMHNVPENIHFPDFDQLVAYKRTAFIAVSKFVRKSFWDRFKLDAYLLYNAIEPPVAPQGSKRLKSIAYLGRIAYEKGVRNLVRMMRLLPDYTLDIYGLGPNSNDAGYCQMLREELVSVPNATWHERWASLEVLDDKQFFVMANVEPESFGIVLLEAMAKGCICIAPDIGAFSEILPRYNLAYDARPSSLASRVDVYGGSYCEMPEHFTFQGYKQAILSVLEALL